MLREACNDHANKNHPTVSCIAVLLSYHSKCSLSCALSYVCLNVELWVAYHVCVLTFNCTIKAFGCTTKLYALSVCHSVELWVACRICVLTLNCTQFVHCDDANPVVSIYVELHNSAVYTVGVLIPYCT